MDAQTEIIRKHTENFPEVIPPSDIPEIFKCSKMTDCDFEEKKIEINFEMWPTALVADGASVNPKAGKILAEKLGLLSPSTRCSVHAATGSLKRASTSKTMQVDELVTFAAGIKPVLKHFKKSGKSSSLLNDALEIMDLKPMKAMVWCPTRMANLLTASKRTSQILFPLCDLLSSTTIQKEHSSYFMSPTCMLLIHLMADLEPLFVGKYLRRLDPDASTIFEVFGCTEDFIATIKELQTPLLDKFVKGLTDDDNGNTIYKNEGTAFLFTVIW